MLRISSAVLLAMLIAACASPFKSAYDPANGKVLIVHKAQWMEYQGYLSMIGDTRQGAFSMHVTNGETDGLHYSLCEYDTCYGGASYANAAMNLCYKDGGECVLFATNRDILVNYKLADE